MSAHSLATSDKYQSCQCGEPDDEIKQIRLQVSVLQAARRRRNQHEHTVRRENHLLEHRFGCVLFETGQRWEKFLGPVFMPNRAQDPVKPLGDDRGKRTCGVLHPRSRLRVSAIPRQRAFQSASCHFLPQPPHSYDSDERERQMHRDRASSPRALRFSAALG